MLDSLAQVELFDEHLSACAALLEQCEEESAACNVPRRAWHDLARQVTRAAYYERLADWDQVVRVCEEADAEVARRKYKAIRTALLCAKARALAHRGTSAAANQALALAVRACPRGAVDPLIVLEASKAVCTALEGRRADAALHFERAVAACRAIGHRYHERWILREREVLDREHRLAAPRRPIDLTDAAVLLTDVATVLGAGHSIDLLTHRTASILQSTPLAARTDVENEGDCEFQPEPTAAWDADADGTVRIQLRGSDRRATIRVHDVTGIDEISFVKSVADLVQAAINRAADTESEDEDQTLWPRALAPSSDDVVFRSPRMVELMKIAARLALSPLPILITGETGTGKEIVARLIHDASHVKRGPFVPFNCSATPKDLVESQLFGHRRGAFTGATESFPGLIRAAENGTLFLDEIGDLEPGSQPKLLRFLESGEVQAVGDLRAQKISVRIVAATNANVEELVRQGRFRSDLFYRVNVARIALPALRERKDEIPALAALFLSRYARECGRSGLRLGDDLIAALLLYDWPGNIRELANEIRRVVAMAADGDTIAATCLTPAILKEWNTRPVSVAVPAVPSVHVRLDQTLARAVDDLEQHFIEHALAETGGRISEAAERLGLSRKGLFLKRRRRGLLSTAASAES